MIGSVYIVCDTDNGEYSNRGVYASRESALAAADEIASEFELISVPDTDLCGSIIAQWIHADYDTVLWVEAHTVSA